MAFWRVAATAAVSAFSLAALAAPSLSDAQSTAPPAQIPLEPPGMCATDGPLRLLCGQDRAEDFAPVPGTPYIITSWLGGGIHLIDTRNRATTPLFPAASAKVQLDKATYPACATSPPTSAQGWGIAGLSLREGANGVHTLYAISLGATAAAHAIQLDARGATPVATYVGCVPPPPDVFLNSLAPVPGGGFVASNWAAANRERMLAGENSGELWEWTPGKGWAKVPGSEASGPNGVAVSADGKWIFMSAYGKQALVKMSRGAAKVERTEVPLGFRMDNMHFAADGSILGAGHRDDSSVHVVKVDPQTLQVTTLLSKPPTDAFMRATAAWQVGDTIWVGSSRTRRIAIFDLPK